MALINCPECQKEISNQAQSCPYCGFPIAKNQNPNDVGSTVNEEGLSTTMSNTYDSVFEKTDTQDSRYHSVKVNAIVALICSATILLSPIGLVIGIIALIRALTIKKSKNLNSLKQIKGFIISIISIILALTICSSVLLFFYNHTHIYGEWSIIQEATCDTDGYQEHTCNICQKTESVTIPSTGHVWSSVTCTQAKKCTVCGKFGESASGHKKDGYSCSKCGITMLEKDDVPKIIDISNCNYDVNSVGGVDVYMTVKNKHSKNIKYIYLEVQFYNAVGDILMDDVRLVSSAKLQITGPIKSGETKSDYYWPACFYNHTFNGTIQIKELKIEYTDGTEIILDQYLAGEAIVNWRGQQKSGYAPIQ